MHSSREFTILLCVASPVWLLGVQCNPSPPGSSNINENNSAQEQPAGLSVRLERIAEGLVSPVAFAYPKDSAGRKFVADQTGKIFIINAANELLSEPFLDISDRLVDLRDFYDERGLLGLAFHPEYSTNGRFYVYYSAPKIASTTVGFDSQTRLSEFRVSVDPNKADASSERELLAINQPQANHNGGPILFGPDGYLYVGVGDGGAANDSGSGHTPDIGNAQDRSNLLGKILRINVDGQTPYDIPPDNPLVDTEGARPELWAWGIRNPWGMSFDAADSVRLFVADVGQNLYEEINVVEGGGNYGWRIKEGEHCFDPSSASNPPDDCPSVGADGEPLIDPIVEYPHRKRTQKIYGISVIGGHVYRGKSIASLVGKYIFGDWQTCFDEGVLFSASQKEDGTWITEAVQLVGEMAGGERYLLQIGEDEDGELYLLTSQTLGPSGNSGEIFYLSTSGTP